MKTNTGSEMAEAFSREYSQFYDPPHQGNQSRSHDISNSASKINLNRDDLSIIREIEWIRSDIENLRLGVEKFRNETENLRLAIEKLRSETQIEIKKLQVGFISEMKRIEVNLVEKMAKYRNATILWIAGFSVTTILTIVGFAFMYFSQG